MSWRTIAAVLIVVFTLIFTQSVLAGPLTTLITDLQNSGDYSDDRPGDFDGEARMTDLQNAWFNMGLLAIFGIMAWGLARVVRRELTRNQGGL